MTNEQLFWTLAAEQCRDRRWRTRCIWSTGGFMVALVVILLMAVGRI